MELSGTFVCTNKFSMLNPNWVGNKECWIGQWHYPWLSCSNEWFMEPASTHDLKILAIESIYIFIFVLIILTSQSNRIRPLVKSVEPGQFMVKLEQNKPVQWLGIQSGFYRSSCRIWASKPKTFYLCLKLSFLSFSTLCRLFGW